MDKTNKNTIDQVRESAEFDAYRRAEAAYARHFNLISSDSDVFIDTPRKKQTPRVFRLQRAFSTQELMRMTTALNEAILHNRKLTDKALTMIVYGLKTDAEYEQLFRKS